MSTATKAKPAAKEPKVRSEWEFQARDLWWAWHVSAKTRSRDESRPVLCGVLAEEFPTGVLFVATDSYRLSRVFVPFTDEQHTPDPGAEPLRSVLISDWHRRVEPFLAHQAKLCTRVVVTPQERVAAFAGEGESITPELIDGEYPTWRSLVKVRDENPGPAAFNPKYLGDICAVAKKAGGNTSVEFDVIQTPNPCHIAIRPRDLPEVFLLLMPVRTGRET